METKYSFEIEFNGVITIETFFDDKEDAKIIFDEWCEEQGVSAEITNIIPLDVKPEDYYTEKINNLLDKIKLNDDGIELLKKVCNILESWVN